MNINTNTNTNTNTNIESENINININKTKTIYHTKGKLIINEFGNGFVNIDDKTIYINKKDIGKAFNLEIVEVEYQESEPDSKDKVLYYGKVINYSLVGKILTGFVHHIYKNEIYIFVPELKKSNMIIIKTKNYLEKNSWVVIKVTSDNNKIEGELVEILSNDVDSIIEKKYNLNQISLDISSSTSISKNKDVTEALSSFIHNHEQHQRFKHVYLDQRNINTFSIDPITSRDCDDAFSIDIFENQIHIYVHISDVSYYINPDHHLFEEIINRGNTYYGSQKNWTMIPREYSDNFCSILPNKETRVVTSEFIYNPELKTLDYVGWYYSIIESKNKLWYEYVDENYNNSELVISNDFKIIYESSQIIKSMMNDYIVCEETKSHEMVRYWMIYTNQIMCKEIQKLYRCNPQPSANKFVLLQEYIKYQYQNQKKSEFITDLDINDRNKIIQFTREHLNDKLCQHIIKSLLIKAYYSDTDEGHYGIGIFDYTHWTSPIRRSTDLINHCILRGYDINPKKYLNDMNEAELKQDNIENFILSYKNFQYQNNHLNETFEATIINVIPTGIVIYIEQFDTRFTIHISKLSENKLVFDTNKKELSNENKTYKMFDKIKVIINKIDFDSIDLSLSN